MAVDLGFQLLWVNTKERDCWECVQFWKKTPNCVAKWLHRFAFPPARTGGPVGPHHAISKSHT